LACVAAAAFLASHHPLWPAAALAAVALMCALEWRRPGAWLFFVPAGLPWLDFSPWTGWTTFEEFDLLVLAALAGGYAGLAMRPGGERMAHRSAAAGRPAPLALLLFGLLSGVAFCVGIRDAGGWSFSWFQGYTEPLNALRAAKSTLFVLLSLPLLEREFGASPRRASTRLCLGMVAGLTVVVAAVLWERAVYPGLLNLSEHYRATALFWEMHVGGAAIDAYMALAAPFVAWALWSARSVPLWSAAALLALCAAYACLATFSRGAYLAVAIELPLLGLLLLRRRVPGDDGRWLRLATFTATGLAAGLGVAGVVLLLGYGAALTALLVLAGALSLRKLRRPASFAWRKLGAWLLAMALVAEVVAVLSASSFMNERLAAADEDFGQRWEHWSHGLSLLRTPADGLFGIGLGRLPARYASEVPDGEFSGAVRLDRNSSTGTALVRLSGPHTQPRLGGLFGLAQRVASEPAYRVRLQARSTVPTRLALRVCQRHLLYNARCQASVTFVVPGIWRAIDRPLQGPALTASERAAWRSALFEVSVLGAGGAVELRCVSLQGPAGTDLLANGDFAAGLAHWWPVAQKYFVPWHIDNLYLEVLIERGLPALFAFLWLASAAVHRSVAVATGVGESPFLAAALCGALIVGLVSSLFDVPRVAYLLQLLLTFALLGARREAAAGGAAE
jgi:hypothetical protein